MISIGAKSYFFCLLDSFVLKGKWLLLIDIDNFGKLSLFVVFLMNVFHEPLKFCINKRFFELILERVLGDKLGRYLLIFFMHKIITAITLQSYQTKHSNIKILSQSTFFKYYNLTLSLPLSLKYNDDFQKS